MKIELGRPFNKSNKKKRMQRFTSMFYVEYKRFNTRDGATAAPNIYLEELIQLDCSHRVRQLSTHIHLLRNTSAVKTKHNHLGTGI